VLEAKLFFFDCFDLNIEHAISCFFPSTIATQHLGHLWYVLRFYTFICCINFYIFMNILFNGDAQKKNRCFCLLKYSYRVIPPQLCEYNVRTISSPLFYSGCTFLQTFYVSLQNCSISIAPEFLFMGERSTDLKGDGMHSSRADVKSKNEIFLSLFALTYSRARLVRMNRARVRRCIRVDKQRRRIIISGLQPRKCF